MEFITNYDDVPTKVGETSPRSKLSAITDFRHFSALDLTSEVTGWPRPLSLYINRFVSRRATRSFFREALAQSGAKRQGGSYPLCRGRMRNGLCRRGLKFKLISVLWHTLKIVFTFCCSDTFMAHILYGIIQWFCYLYECFAIVFEGKLWNFRNMIRSSVPTKCLSRIFWYLWPQLTSFSWPPHYKSMGKN